ncbi:hypothetical protein ACP4OV_020480 [Aristida adscensionis]
MPEEEEEGAPPAEGSGSREEAAAEEGERACRGRHTEARDREEEEEDEEGARDAGRRERRKSRGRCRSKGARASGGSGALEARVVRWRSGGGWRRLRRGRSRMWRRRPEAVGGGGPGRGARDGGAVMDGARDARRGAGSRRQIAVFVPARAAAAREAEVALAATGGGHYEAGGLVHQDQDPGLRRMTETILKAIEDRRRQEEEAAASAALAARPPSLLAALEIVMRPSLVVPLTVLSTVAVALSQCWLKLEPVDLGEVVKDLYGRRQE